MENKPLIYQIEIRDIFKIAHHDAVEDVFTHVNNQLTTHLGDVTPEEVIDFFVQHATQAYETELKQRMLTKMKNDFQKIVEANS